MESIESLNTRTKMRREISKASLPDEAVLEKIFFIRRRKVMLDEDLAELYGVTTGNLNKAVKRNLARFPEDFMFLLSKEELENLIFQFGISSWGGRRKPPFAFTEQGVAMLSGILNSSRAIRVNIQIMRIFTRMRHMLEVHREILLKLENLEKKDFEHEEKITLIFEYLKQLEQVKQEERDFQNRPKVGYRKS